MTDKRRYNEARRRVRDFLDPVVEVMASTDALIVELENKVIAADATLEALRPVWAHDVTQQTIASALGEVWRLLDATDQTQAMQRLRYLRTLVPPNVEWDDPLPSLEERARGTWHPGDEA